MSDNTEINVTWSEWVIWRRYIMAAYKYELKLENGGVKSDYKDKSWSLKMLILTSTEIGLIVPANWRAAIRYEIFKFSLVIRSVSPLSHWLPLRTTITCRLRLKCDGTRAETRFRLSAKRTSPFKSAGGSVQSTTGGRGVRISVSNAGYTTFRGSAKSTGYPLHSPVSP